MAAQRGMLAPGSAVRGDRFEFEKEPFTTRQLVMYAGASGDFNRIHYDHSFAVEAGLGGVIAHGMLSMGCLGQAVLHWATPGSVVKSIRARFVYPVRPGDALRFVGIVLDMTGDGECEVEVQGFVGEKLVITGSARLALRPSDAE